MGGVRTIDGAHLSPARPVTLRRAWVHDHGPTTCLRVTGLIGAETHGYQLRHICVLSSSELAEYQGKVCPHNHVTVSVLDGRRPTDEEVALVRSDFDMEDAEEDNHQPGRIRNLFLPLHLPRGTTGICDCKTDETAVIEADGFRWSKTKERTS